MVSSLSAGLERNSWVEYVQQDSDENSSQVNGNTQRQGSLGNSHSQKMFSFIIFTILIIAGLQPFHAGSARCTFLQNLPFIVQAILAYLQGMSEEMGLHDLGQSICKLCGTMDPSYLYTLSYHVFDCSRLQLRSKLLALWWSGPCD